jgi:hypothetical protein
MSERTAKGNTLSRGERLQIMLDAGELTAIDDFRFAQRMPSRAAAVRELMRRGLIAEGAEVGAGGASSQAFGVIESPSEAPRPRALKPARGGV